MVYAEHEAAIRRLTLQECFNGNRTKTLNEFRELGIPLTAANWLTLSGALIEWKKNMSHDASFNLKNFIEKIKKGSRKIRNLFGEIKNLSYDLTGTVAITTFCGLIDCAIPATEIISSWTSTWAVNFLCNDLKVFIYNCRFNCLPLNNRLNAYRPEIDARCSFCRIIDRSCNTRENFKHIFFLCNTTSALIDLVLEKIALRVEKNSDEFLNLYWFGVRTGDSHPRIAWQLFFDTFRYVVYRFKLKKNIPNSSSFLRDFCFGLKNLTLVNKKFKRSFSGQEELAWFIQAIG
jgi:hypothetical protein